MAKKPAKSDRQARIDAIRNQQKGAERRRGFAIVGVCATIAVLMIGAAAFQPVKNWWDTRSYSSTALADIGAAASSCTEVTRKPADGNQQHVDVGTEVEYQNVPPAFGGHYATPAPMDRKFYTTGDRPDLRELIHNMEHGYTFLWYDETAADDSDMMAEIRAISDKFSGTSNLRMKFKAVPWTSDDRTDGGTDKKFPEGQHIALTHWSADPANPSDEAAQEGIWQYCPAPSGEALETFMKEHPYFNSPEPNAM